MDHDRDLDSEPTISAWTSEVDEEALLHYGVLPLKQDALETIVASRRRMGLPPFFAVLSNQIMERPYRMDKLSIAIGRWDAKDPCDVSVGSDPHLLTHQWTIRYSYARGCFVLESSATHPKPFALKLGQQRYEYRGPRARVALPNPALIDLAGSYYCFQIFAITHTESERSTPDSDEERSPVPRKRRAEEGPGSVESIAPMSTKRRNMGQLGKKRRGVTYVKMVEQALANLSGAATHREICAYIEKNFTDFLTNQNWQASISVTLSATEKFQRRNTMREVDGKKEKTSVWVLSGTSTDQASDD